MDSSNSTQAKIDVYQIVTNRIIELLEQGTVPWQKPWREAGMPTNLISKRPYRGINFWLLLSLNYDQNLFLTWDQIKKSGGSVKQGEHGHVIIYWKTPANIQEGEEQTTKAPFLRYYKVFNIAQTRDLPADLNIPMEQITFEPLLACENIIAGMKDGPKIQHKEQRAYYDVERDLINMPRKKSFKTIPDYYSTLFHELVHSTGSTNRLQRKSLSEMAEFGSELYSLEELVAELGSSYLASHANILSTQLVNNAAYINGWLQKLKSDNRFIVVASSFAQKAVNLILNREETPPADEETP